MSTGEAANRLGIFVLAQRQGIIVAVVSCLLCYISLFFHWKVWYTQLNKSKVIGEIAMSFQELFNKFFAKGKPF